MSERVNSTSLPLQLLYVSASPTIEFVIFNFFKPIRVFQIVPERINSRGRAPEQNCQPGTVVDKGVMNAALTEFLLIPHKALQVFFLI